MNPSSKARQSSHRLVLHRLAWRLLKSHNLDALNRIIHTKIKLEIQSKRWMDTCHGYFSYNLVLFFSGSSRHLNKPVWDLRFEIKTTKWLFFLNKIPSRSDKRKTEKKFILNGLCLTWCSLFTVHLKKYDLNPSIVKLFLSRTLNIQPDIINPVDPFIHLFCIRVEKKRKNRLQTPAWS